MMRKSFFYASYILAVAVFYAFYMFMLWASVEMGNKIADAGGTVWTALTEAGMVALTVFALALFLIAAYNLLVKGPSDARAGAASPALSPQARGARQSAVNA